jgi:hypothetical protein
LRTQSIQTDTFSCRSGFHHSHAEQEDATDKLSVAFYGQTDGVDILPDNLGLEIMRRGRTAPDW